MGENSHGHVHINKRLLAAGGVLLAVGGLLGFAGMAIGGTALLIAGRQWVRQMEVPPRELAASKWRQARAASVAGAHAWRDAGHPDQP